MAVDPLIVVGMAVLILVIFVVNIYILVYYSHPEDKNESYLAKALVVTGLQLSAMSVLMLPIGKIQALLCAFYKLFTSTELSRSATNLHS